MHYFFENSLLLNSKQMNYKYLAMMRKSAFYKIVKFIAPGSGVLV